MDKSNRMKVIISVIGVISLAIMVFATTYAWFKWRTTNQQIVNINLTASSTITFYGGPDIHEVLEPVYDKEDGIVKDIRITSDLAGNEFSLYLRLNTLPGYLQDESFVWAIYKNGVEYDSGDFGNAAEEDVITLVDGEEISYSSEDIYTLYLWIDAYQDNNYLMSGQTVDFDLYATGDTGVLDELPR